jgi:hypothetical protein
LSPTGVVGAHETAAGLGKSGSPTLPTFRDPKWECQPPGAKRFSTLATFPTLERVRSSDTPRVNQAETRSASEGDGRTRPQDLCFKVGKVGKVGNACRAGVCSSHLAAREMEKVGDRSPVTIPPNPMAAWRRDQASPGSSTLAEAARRLLMTSLRGGRFHRKAVQLGRGDPHRLPRRTRSVRRRTSHRSNGRCRSEDSGLVVRHKPRVSSVPIAFFCKARSHIR